MGSTTDLRMLGVEHFRSLPLVPISHPFIERLIGTIRREFLDHSLFWNEQDLNRKLDRFVDDYNRHRVHSGLNGRTHAEAAGAPGLLHSDTGNFAWKSFCNGLFQPPTAA